MKKNVSVRGFQFSAVKSGIRGKDRLDIGLIYCEKPADVGAVFTTSAVKAAPVILGEERVKSGKSQAVMINSGIANACTGEQGMKNAKSCSLMAAKALNIPEELVLVSSTGVIGQQLEMDCFEKHVSSLAAGLAAEGMMDVAKAIMTTDTVPKTATVITELGGKQVTFTGMAKGAGMIMPNMATMLSFVMTDANVSSGVLQEVLRKSADKSFNCITVDGDTSTNDTVIIMASGFAGNERIESLESADVKELQNSLDTLTEDLARQIVADGEGATKLVSIIVKEAASLQEAEMAAKTIANSPLVKTAFFGQDANWGRIIAALGRSGAHFDQNKVRIAFDDAMIVEYGLWLGQEAEVNASKVLKQDSFTVTINLQAGDHQYKVLTCDLSFEYIKINADYRT